MATITESSLIKGVQIVEPQAFGDSRGTFIETYRREWFPLGREMLQGNRGDRQAGCIVGLHYHLHQADYWYVPIGSCRVVLHDLRVGSPTDGATQVIDIGARADGTHDHRGIFIPPGVAHGFASLTNMAITYLVDSYYNPKDELGLAYTTKQLKLTGVSPSQFCLTVMPQTRREMRLTHRCDLFGQCGPKLIYENFCNRWRWFYRLELCAMGICQHRSRNNCLRFVDIRRQLVDSERR